MNMRTEKDLHVYTVSEITKNIKLLLESGFSAVWVEGEISGYKLSSSGHAYFNLKDKEAVLPAALFKNTRNFLKFDIKDGLRVMIFGRISLYERSGVYKLYVEKIEPGGIGALSLAFEQLKKKLEKEGLFDKEKKKPIPFLPSCIGIVTSRTGAAIRDILNVLNRRFANVNIILRPVKVQGGGAAEEIALAIEELNDFSRFSDRKIDVIIVGRGGGSMEDLWAFNEEIVARAIYNSDIPIISAVGHQIDFTIADFVADLRASTPSVAAELVIADKEHLLKNLTHISSRLKQGVLNNFEHKRKRLKGLTRTYIFKSPQNRILYNMEKVDEFAERLHRRVRYFLELQGQRVKGMSARLESLSPLSVLARGYSISFVLPERKIVLDSAGLKEGDEILTKVKKGSFVSVIKKIV